jgi:hypothetical protein
MEKDYLIQKRDSYDLPADIQGLDSIVYSNYKDLRKKIMKRIKDRYEALLSI